MESTSVDSMIPIAAPLAFSSIVSELNSIFVGASLTAVTSNVYVAESDPPLPSVTVSTRLPIVSATLLTSALGVNDIYSN